MALVEITGGWKGGGITRILRAVGGIKLLLGSLEKIKHFLHVGSVGGVVCKEGGGESRRVVRVVCDPVVGVQKPLRVGRVDKRRGSSVQKPIGKCGWHL